MSHLIAVLLIISFNKILLKINQIYLIIPNLTNQINLMIVI